MNWQLLPQFAITGFLTGGPIALIALGLVLIYKSSEIFNFAHGQMLLIGAMATWWFSSDQALGRIFPGDEQFALRIGLAILLALLTSVILGLAIERLTLRPMTGQPLLSIILMTLALSQVLQGLTILVFGTTQRNFPVLFTTTAPYRFALPLAQSADTVSDCRFAIGGTPQPGCLNVILRQDLFWSFAIAMACVVLLYFFFQYTRTGLSMRATAEDHETAQAVGIRINRVFGFSWAIAGVIATVSGIHQKIPQIGTVRIEDDVEIGSCVIIDRARFDSTLIKRGVKIDNLVQIAHNVTIGEHTIVVAQVGISGSATIGKNVIIAGQAGIIGHVEVGDNVIIAGKSGVTKNIPAGKKVSGFPAREHTQDMKIQAYLHKQPELWEKVLEMEARLTKLEKDGTADNH